MTDEQERLLNSVHEHVVASNVKLDYLTMRMTGHEAEDKATHSALSATHNVLAARVGSLETTRTRFSGLYAAFALVPSALAFLWWLHGLIGSAKAQ